MPCTACGGDLEEGFLPDIGESINWISVWVRGPPRLPPAPTSVLDALTSLGTHGVKPGDSEALAVVARRCTRCGHLELFASEPPPPHSNPFAPPPRKHKT